MSTHQSWKDVVRNTLPWSLYWRLRRIREEVLTFFAPDTLTGFAAVYKTDKGKHRITDVYHQWFSPLRYKPIRLLEIGIGGDDKKDRGGNSLRMWKRYFPFAHITGIDIYEKSRLAESRISMYHGDQSDESFLHEVNTNEGPFDVIIDDGSHMQSHIIKSFEVLFPLLNSNGIYIIEDTQTSYWPAFEGSTADMRTTNSIMNFIISKVHDVNAVEWIKAELPADTVVQYPVASIAFYHNLIILVKA